MRAIVDMGPIGAAQADAVIVPPGNGRMVLAAIDLTGAPAPWLLLIKAAAVVVLVVAALALFRSSRIDRTPDLAARRQGRREARRAPYVSPHAKPLPPQPVASKLPAGLELDRLAGILDAASHRVQAVHAATATAAREIDGAEIALNRLLREIADVMPAVIAPTIVPRRELSAAVAARHAVAA